MATNLIDARTVATLLSLPPRQMQRVTNEGVLERVHDEKGKGPYEFGRRSGDTSRISTDSGRAHE